MSFKVHENNGNWGVSKDGLDVHIHGGVEIDYATYKELRDNPAKAGSLYHRDVRGVLRKKSKKA
jgi:hypothetical protein